MHGASASAGALCGGAVAATTVRRAVQLIEVESASGARYAGFVLTGEVPFRPWLAKTLNRVAVVVFEAAP